MEGDGETKLECPTTQFTPAAAPKFVEMESMNAQRVSCRNVKVAQYPKILIFFWECPGVSVPAFCAF